MICRVLKRLIEQVMARVEPLASTSNNSSSSGSTVGNEDLLRANEMIMHLQEERQQLLNRNHDYDISISSLQDANNDLIARTTAYQKEIEALNLQISSSSAINSTNSDMSIELEELKRELDVLQVTLDSLKLDYGNEKKTVAMLKDIQTKNESEIQQMQDELDVARGNASKVSKLELENDKLKKKLEEINALKKENIELNKTLDSYLDKIRDFEIASKGSSNLQKMIDQYKDKVIEGETKNFELMSINDILKKELEQERKDRQDEKKKANDDIGHFQTQLEEYKHLIEEKNDKTTNLNNNDRTSTNNNSIAFEEIAALKQQILELSTTKKILDNTCFDDKRIINDLNDEIKRLNEKLCTNSESSSNLKELEQKLATIQLLENKLKEKENKLIRLEQDKSKLHSFYEQSFSNFKEKHLATIYELKTLCKSEKKRNDELREIYEKSKEQHSRVSRMLTSSFFELGAMLFNKNIQMKISEEQATYLGKVRQETFQRRQEVEKQLIVSSQSSSTPITPQFR